MLWRPKLRVEQPVPRPARPIWACRACGAPSRWRKSSRPPGRSSRAPLRDPGVRVAPEARPVLGEWRGRTRVSGSGTATALPVHERGNSSPCSACISRAGSQAAGSDRSMPTGSRATAGHPGREVGGAAAHLDPRREPVHVGHHADFGLGHAVHAPRDLRRWPSSGERSSTYSACGHIPGRLVGLLVAGQVAAHVCWVLRPVRRGRHAEPDQHEAGDPRACARAKPGPAAHGGAHRAGQDGRKRLSLNNPTRIQRQAKHGDLRRGAAARVSTNCGRNAKEEQRQSWD